MSTTSTTVLSWTYSCQLVIAADEILGQCARYSGRPTCCVSSALVYLDKWRSPKMSTTNAFSGFFKTDDITRHTVAVDRVQTR